jgi:hypothetical protein
MVHSKKQSVSQAKTLTVGGTAGLRVVEHLVVNDATNHKVILNDLFTQVIVSGPEAAEDQLAGALLGG